MASIFDKVSKITVLQILAQIAAVLILFIFYGVVFGIFNDTTLTQSTRHFPEISDTNWAHEDWDVVVYVGVTIANLDPAGGTMALSLTVLLPDAWLQNKSTKLITSLEPVLEVGISDFKLTSYYTQLSTTVAANGHLLRYPFDEYKSTIPVLLEYNSLPDVQDPLLVVDVTPREVYGFEAWQIAPSTDKDYEGWSTNLNTRALDVAIRRTILTKVYPVFIIVSLWLIICVLMYFFSVYIIWQTKKVETGIVALFSSLMFALPAFRNTAPSVPAMGCLLDYSSFFWAMFIAIICFVCIAVRYLATPAAPAAPAPKPKEEKTCQDATPALPVSNATPKPEQPANGIELKTMM